jgi:hypothetical protein
MKFILIAICFTIMALTTISFANADIRAPKPTPATQGKIVLHTSLEIVPDAKTYEARLQIPQSELQNLRAALDGIDNNRTFAASISRSSPRTIIAGVLLFLSISFAGVWLARSSQRSGPPNRITKLIVIGLMAIATIGVATIITRGNAGPPGYYRWRNLPKSLSDGKATVGGLDIEIVPDEQGTGRNMRLIIPLRKEGSGEE